MMTIRNGQSDHFREAMDEELRRKSEQSIPHQEYISRLRCDYCNKPIGTVYVINGLTHCCCSAGCLAHIYLNVITMSPKQWEERYADE